jgi:hypothetical protein
MPSTRGSRRGPGRFAAAALTAAAAAVALLAAEGPAYAGPASGAEVPVIPIMLSGDWSGSAGFGSGAPGWYVDTSPAGPAVVHLQGAVQQVSTTAVPSPDVIGLLPRAARPDRSVYELVHTFDGTYADIDIDPTGNITLIPPRPPAVQDFSFVSLEGVSYEQSISAVNVPIPVNTPDWSASAGYDSVAPSAWADGSGFVHLQGALTQAQPPNPVDDPLVLATLPAEFRPEADASVVAHSFNGTYARLIIDTSGQIILIGAQSPAINDDSFVSLEGITFSQDGADAVPVTVNTANFAPAPAGVFPLSASMDSSGVVHLFGTVRQTDTTGGDVFLVGTVPSGYRPDRYVYGLVATFLGTYADAVVTPAGQIYLIYARAPLASNSATVSLDGLSYQP